MINGRAYKKEELLREGPTPVLRVGNFFTSDKWYFSDLELEGDKYCDTGDLLYAWSASFGPRIWEGGRVIYHYHIWKLEPDDSIVDRRWLYYWLLWDTEQIKKAHGVGATMLHVTKGAMEQRQLHIPVLADQRQIVAILDETFDGIAKATANAERNLANARELFESSVNLLLQRDSLHWPSGPVQDMVGEVRTGPFGSLLHKSDYVVGGIPIVNPAHLIDGSIVADQSKTVSATTAQNLSSYKIQTGDIVIGRRGEMGRCAVVSDDENGWICGTGSFFIRPHVNVSPHFVAALLRSVKYRRQLESLAGGATMPNLSNSALGQMAIALPDYQTQKITVSDWSELKEQCWTAADAYRRKRSILSELKSSLLEKAFTGQLTNASAVAA